MLERPSSLTSPKMRSTWSVIAVASFLFANPLGTHAQTIDDAGKALGENLCFVTQKTGLGMIPALPVAMNPLLQLDGPNSGRGARNTSIFFGYLKKQYGEIDNVPKSAFNSIGNRALKVAFYKCPDSFGSNEYRQVKEAINTGRL